MTASEQTEIEQSIPRITFNGEDCIIIPMRQIVNVEFNYNNSPIIYENYADLIITVRARG